MKQLNPRIHTGQILPTLLMVVITLFSVPSHASEDGKRGVEAKSSGTVIAGKQVWMNENLAAGRYRNGDPIRHAATREEWLDAAAKGEGAWCYYNNDPENGKRYGCLYNWHAVSDPRGLAPKGWHVPTDAEWTALSAFLGGDAVAGGKMKAGRSSLWRTPNESASKSSGFEVLPGGLRGIDGAFTFGGESAYFWSATEHSPSLAWYRVLNYHVATLVRSGEEKIDGMSVRCIRD